jgi:hypothetical protein
MSMTNDKPDKPGNSMPPPQAADKSEARMKNTSSSGRLSRDVQSKIGQQLRAMYDDVVKEGVPDRFSDLLRQLDKSDDGNTNEGSRG